MNDRFILTMFVYGVPFVAVAAVIAGVGFVLRRVRPDLYMTDEEKTAAAQKADIGTDSDNDSGS